MSNKGLGYVMVVMLMLVALVIACAPKHVEELPPVKIGALIEFTGPTAPKGEAQVRGINFKLDEVNWEVAGRKIELITEDAAGDPTISVDKARKLVEQDQVDVVLGPLVSHCGAAVAGYLAPLGVPNIAYEEHSADILKFDNVFLPRGVLRDVAYPLGVYAYDKLGYRTTTAIAQDFVSGIEFCQGFIDGFTERGGTLVQKQLVPIGTVDFAPYLTGIKKADCVIFWLFDFCLPAFGKQYREYGLKMPLFLAMIANCDEATLAEIGDIALDMTSIGRYSPVIDTDANKRFVEAFVNKYGAVPESTAVSSLVSTSLFLEAVRATGGDTAPERLVEALKHVTTDTPLGTVSLTSERIAICPKYIFEVTKIGDRYAWEVIEKVTAVSRR